MDENNTQYVSADSLENLKKECEILKNKTIPEIAKRIDEAKQQGDLSENAEYHQAREDMSWAQGRMRELEQVINNARVIDKAAKGGAADVGSTVAVKINGDVREYTIVGQQEANPSRGLISNESPLGSAFLGRKQGETVEIIVPSGKQVYEILEVK